MSAMTAEPMSPPSPPGSSPSPRSASASSPSSSGLRWRTAEPADAVAVSRALDEWWEQRLNHCVQPQLFEHFGDTTLIVEEDGELVAFLVGWLSQCFPDAAYVHFMGVRGDHRRLGLELYRRFAALARKLGRTRILAETGAFNHRSIAFHRAIGMTAEPGDEVIDGVPVHHDRIGIGGDYVVFSMDLESGML
jgi:GNAT superfamily N-acetyltransferase